MKTIILLAFILIQAASGIFAQDKTTGGVKGVVKSPAEKTISDVTVEAKQNGKTVATARTNNKGDFTIVNLKPGSYIFVFTKAGFSEGISKEIEIKAGTVSTLKRLYLSVDQGTLAIVRGSVFDYEGRIARGVKVEVMKVVGDAVKKVGERYTDNSGEFALRLPPEPGRYRFIAAMKDSAPTSTDLVVDGAEVYRFAITLKSDKNRNK